MAKKRGAMEIIGFDELYGKLAAIADISNTKETRNVMLTGAGRIKGDAQRRLSSQVVRRTGTRLNPEKAIVAKLFKKQRRQNPMAFAAWDYKVSQLGHLFEFGTKHMKARPFLRPAIDGTKTMVASVIEKGMKKIVEETARKTARKLTAAQAKAKMN